VTHFAISVDTPETNKAFAQAVAVDYPILSDPSRKVATAYGVVDEDQPFPSRWTFYIGSDGRILFVDKQVTPTSHGKNVAAKLAELGIPRRRASQEDDFAILELEKTSLAAFERQQRLFNRQATAVTNE
jgi:peroxiredoxin Q/BCP